VTDFFRKKTALRALVGVAAGYALAVQLLLTGILATQMTAGASADPFVICLSDGTSPDSPHGNNGTAHQTCAICTLASAAPLLPHAATPTVVRIETAVVFVASAQSVANVRGRHNPRSSQGPPRNV
jgi:hypothetical protein